MKAYYAHCQAIYNTKQEKRDIMTLELLGFEVLNPNMPVHQQVCREREYSQIMSYFTDLLKGCEVFAFRGLPGGAIPAEVAKELEVANENGKLIFELPTFSLRKILTVDETREYLKESGQR